MLKSENKNLQAFIEDALQLDEADLEVLALQMQALKLRSTIANATKRT